MIMDSIMIKTSEKYFTFLRNLILYFMSYLQSNAKFYIKDILSSTLGVAGTFRISPDLELGNAIET